MVVCFSNGVALMLERLNWLHMLYWLSVVVNACCCVGKARCMRSIAVFFSTNRTCSMLDLVLWWLLWVWLQVRRRHIF